MSKTINNNDFVTITKNDFRLANILHLNYGALIIFCKINKLANDKNKNVCTASNSYFAEFMKTDERTIQRYIKTLRDKGIIKSHEEKKGNTTTTRYIYVQRKIIKEILDKDTTILTCDNGGHDNFCTTTRQNLHEDTTEFVEPHVNPVTHIIDYNRIYNNIEADTSTLTDDMSPAIKNKKQSESQITTQKNNIYDKLASLYDNDKYNSGWYKTVANKNGYDVKWLNQKWDIIQSNFTGNFLCDLNNIKNGNVQSNNQCRVYEKLPADEDYGFSESQIIDWTIDSME